MTKDSATLLFLEDVGLLHVFLGDIFWEDVWDPEKSCFFPLSFFEDFVFCRVNQKSTPLKSCRMCTLGSLVEPRLVEGVLLLRFFWSFKKDTPTL